MLISFKQLIFAVVASFLYAAFLAHEWTIGHVVFAVILMMLFNHCNNVMMAAS